MEPKPQFDLNVAMRRWRESMADSPHLGSDTADELQSHLQDSVAELRKRDLSEEEAFMVAAHRLGSARVLDAEFCKLPPAVVWQTRLWWMLVGMLSFKLVTGFAYLASQGAILMSASLTENARLLGGVGIASWLICVAAMVIGIRAVFRGKVDLGIESIRFTSTSPLRFGVLALCLLIGLRMVSMAALMVTTRILGVQQFGQVIQWLAWIGSIGPATLGLLAVLLLAHAQRPGSEDFSAADR